MNWPRLIKGFFLSCVFLLFFTYIIANEQLFFNNLLNDNRDLVLAGISNDSQGISGDNATKNSDIARKDERQEIKAQAAVSIESNLLYNDRIIFDKNSNEKLPIASLTKLMTAVIVLDNYNLSDIIAIDENADSQVSLPQDVKLGDEMPVESFLKIMLIGSSNKSAHALAAKMGAQKFIYLMNLKAKEIGLQNTSFKDPTGLAPEDISTANDLSKLAKYILKNYPKITEITSKKELEIPGFGKIENTDQLLGEIPEIICSKTGFTETAKGCLLLVINNPKNNDYMINVILGSDDRFQDMKNLINCSNTNI